jgi:hypothetical protein
MIFKIYLRQNNFRFCLKKAEKCLFFKEKNVICSETYVVGVPPNLRFGQEICWFSKKVAVY